MIAVLVQPRVSVAVTVSVAGCPLGLVLNDTLVPLVLKSVPLTIVHCTFDQFVFISAGESIQTKSPEPGQTDGYSIWITGGGMERTSVVMLAEAVHPWLSVAVTVSVAG